MAGSPVPFGVSEGATLRIDAPSNAEVWVNGKQLSRSSQGWVYQTGVIPANGVENIHVRARWGTGHYEADRTADVVLRPGSQQSVTFLSGEAGTP